MNEVFSFRRFGKLFVKHTADHYRSYLMSIAVVAGVLVLGGSFIGYMVMGLLSPAAQVVLFFSLLTLAGTIFASTIFSDLGEKKRSIPALLLPASTLEKFLVAWMYSYVVFIVIFTIMFYFALAAVLYSQTMRGFDQQMMDFFSRQMFLQFVFFSFLQSIAMFGAIFFGKLHFIKTAFCFFISIGLLILFSTVWGKIITGKDVAPRIPFGNIAFRENNQWSVVSITEDKMIWIMWVGIAVTILFWVATYFRLKEKRV